MTTAAEFREYARECIESARDATSDPERLQFLDIAKLWLKAAARADAGTVVASQAIDKMNGHAHAGSA